MFYKEIQVGHDAKLHAVIHVVGEESNNLSPEELVDLYQDSVWEEVKYPVWNLGKPTNWIKSLSDDMFLIVETNESEASGRWYNFISINGVRRLTMSMLVNVFSIDDLKSFIVYGFALDKHEEMLALLSKYNINVCATGFTKIKTVKLHEADVSYMMRTTLKVLEDQEKIAIERKELTLHELEGKLMASRNEQEMATLEANIRRVKAELGYTPEPMFTSGWNMNGSNN